MVKAEEKQKRQQKVDSILEEIKKLNDQLTTESKMVSFEIKSLLQKLLAKYKNVGETAIFSCGY